MEGGTVLDIFATKGVEYLVVIGYLILLVMLAGLFRPAVTELPRRAASVSRRLAEVTGTFFHPGHAWAREVPADDSVLVGWDDLARRVIGPPDEIRLPDPGTRVRLGQPAWSLSADGGTVEMLSPVEGEVLEVNPALAAQPDILTRDPYGDGWLMRVRPDSRVALRRNLLSGPPARDWMRWAEERLGALLAPEGVDAELATTLADGGMPTLGLGRAFAPERWVDVARELLLTGQEPQAGP